MTLNIRPDYNYFFFFINFNGIISRSFTTVAKNFSHPITKVHDMRFVTWFH